MWSAESRLTVAALKPKLEALTAESLKRKPEAMTVEAVKPKDPVIVSVPAFKNTEQSVRLA